MIITQTPLRISLLGGGTDFPRFYKEHGGAVLSFALDKYIYCIVHKPYEENIYVNYSKKEIAVKVSEIKHELVREALRLTGIQKQVEISFLSDVPAYSGGTGLGSSSSVTVGVLNGLHLYRGEVATEKQLAEEACQIEVETLKNPQGIQDQYIAAFGGLRLFKFSDKKVEVEDVGLKNGQTEDLLRHIMVFYTGQGRKSKTVLKEQKKKIKKNEKSLIKMSKLANEGKKAIENSDYRKLGELIHKSWDIKKNFASKVTNPKIDKMYSQALDAGAYGGKISGAGNGGFMTLIVPPEKKTLVRKALFGYNELSVGIARVGSKVIFDNGR